MTDLIVSRPGGVQERQALAAASPSDAAVSCLMVSRGERPQAKLAIDCFRRQRHANRELVVACDRDDTPLERHVRTLDDPTIRFVRTTPGPLGALRNQAVAAAEGALFCQWDDDDLCATDRIGVQLAALSQAGAAASTMLRWTLWAPVARRLAVSARRQWEGSLMIRREAQRAYPALDVGEDFRLVAELREAAAIAAVDAPEAMIYVAHGANTCGAWHFRGLFDAATAVVGDYEGRLAELGVTMPVGEYSGVRW